VPYINAWGPQTVENTTVEHCPYATQDAVFMADDFDAGPDFTKQSPQRQRRCMVLGLCQVCAKPVPWSRRNLVVSGDSVDFVSEQGHRMALVHEPWLCDRCAHIAVTWCPALIRRTREEHLEVIPVRSAREVLMRVSHGWIAGPLEAQTRARPVAMYVKAQLLRLQLEPATGWTVIEGRR